MILLNVPFEQKDQAKALGARWNPELKKWYVQNPKDYGKFAKWLWKDYEDEETLCAFFNHIFIVESFRTCFKCKKPTRVIGFGVESYYAFHYDIYENNDEYEFDIIHNDDISITSIPEDLPDTILQYCYKNWNFKRAYSKTIQDNYLANCCDHCDSLQGDFFLFSEPDSPFVFIDRQKAENIKLHEIKLSSDIALCNYDFCFDSSQQYQFIKKFSKKELALEL